MSYTLTFSQLVGEFVTDKELLGAQDPYVVFEAGGKKSQTKVRQAQIDERQPCAQVCTAMQYSLPSLRSISMSICAQTESFTRIRRPCY